MAFIYFVGTERYVTTKNSDFWLFTAQILSQKFQHLGTNFYKY
jgi:hypothetical protein